MGEYKLEFEKTGKVDGTFTGKELKSLLNNWYVREKDWLRLTVINCKTGVPTLFHEDSYLNKVEIADL